MVDLFLPLVGFNFDGFKKIFNFTNKAIDLFLLFDFVLNHNFFKAWIKIQKHEIVSGLVQKLQSLILRLLKKCCNFLKFILKSYGLEFRAISVGI